MARFPDIQLVSQPDNSALAEHDLAPAAAKKMLVVYDANLPFLERVLAAAGYKDPKNELHLLRHEAGDEPFDLAALAQVQGLERIVLLGQDPAKLGLHFVVANYAPVDVAGRKYLLGESVAYIAQQKEEGRNGPAAALWNALKAGFLREEST